MAHHITMTDRLAYTGEHPWHLSDTKGRSIRIGDAPAALREAFKVALPFEPVIVPAYFLNPLTGAFEVIPDQHAVIRDDGKGALGVVGDRYTLFSHESMQQLVEELAGLGAKAHTVGSLHGGRRVFCAIEAGSRISLRNGADAIDPFLFLTTAHDGSSKLTVKFTAVRPVCANTVALALGDRKAAFHARHTASIGDVRDVARRASEVLSIATESFKVQAQLAEALIEAPMSKVDFQLFACEVLTGLDGEEALREVAEAKGRSSTMFERKGNELVQLFHKGLGNHGRTLWDGLNSVTEWVDHQRGRSAAFRAKQRSMGLESALFGDGERKKQRAVELLVRRLGR